jgi:ATP-binding cassette subfamily C protein LapB
MKSIVARYLPGWSETVGEVEDLPTAGDAMPVTRCLRELSEAWNLSHATTPDDAAQVLSQGALDSAARELSLDVTYVTQRVTDLAVRDFPCVVLLKSGLARVLLERSSEWCICRAGGQRYRMKISDIEHEATHTVFMPRPADQFSAAVAFKSERSLLGALLEHMFFRRKGILVQLLLAASLGNILLLTLPLFSMAVYDRVIPHGAMETLWALAIGVIIALLLDMAIRYVRLKLQDALAVSGVEWLQTRAYTHILSCRLAVCPRGPGTFSAQMRELESLCQSMPGLLTGMLVDVPFLFLVIVLLAHLGGSIAIVPILGVIAIIVVHLICHTISEKDSRQAAHIAQRQSDILVDTLAEIEAIKSSSSESRFMERWERITDAHTLSGHQSRLWNGVAAYSNVVMSQLVLVFVMLVAVYKISDDVMTLGALSAATMLVGRAMVPMGQMVGLWHRMYHLQHLLKTFEAFLATPAERAKPTHGLSILPGQMGAIAFRNVSFGYGSALNRLQDVTLNIQPGERVGLIGRSGSGKSTLLRLMTRLHDPDQGAVLYDGTDIRQFEPRRLRSVIGYMRQDAALLDESLLANIVMFEPEVDRARLDRAIAISGVQEFVARSPEGFGMPVGPRGERLSMGERQSVLLARLLYMNTPALLLDEPTASMDTVLEARIAQELGHFIGSRTLVLATHRSAMLAAVDRLIWLDGGRVIADGPKAEVLARLKRAA